MNGLFVKCVALFQDCPDQLSNVSILSNRTQLRDMASSVTMNRVQSEMTSLGSTVDKPRPSSPSSVRPSLLHPSFCVVADIVQCVEWR